MEPAMKAQVAASFCEHFLSRKCTIYFYHLRINEHSKSQNESLCSCVFAISVLRLHFHFHLHHSVCRYDFHIFLCVFHCTFFASVVLPQCVCVCKCLHKALLIFSAESFFAVYFPFVANTQSENHLLPEQY